MNWRVRSCAAIPFLLVLAATMVQAQRKTLLTDRQTFGRVNYSSAAVISGNQVDGYVKVTGNNRFVFPVSDNSVFRPFAASADGTMGAYFSANPAVATTSSHKGGNYPPLPSGAPFSLTSKDANIGKVSSREYWDINGGTPTKITFSWHLESGMSSFAPGGNMSKVYIVGWNGSKWVKINTTIDAVSLFGGASNVNAGSMTTVDAIVPNTYLAYTFGADLSAAREMAPGAEETIASLSGREMLKLGASADSDMTIYPNPVRERIFVTDHRKIRRVSIIDLAGRSLLSVGNSYKNGIDIQNLSNGIYIVNVEDEKGMIKSRKIIVNK